MILYVASQKEHKASLIHQKRHLKGYHSKEDGTGYATNIIADALGGNRRAATWPARYCKENLLKMKIVVAISAAGMLLITSSSTIVTSSNPFR